MLQKNKINAICLARVAALELVKPKNSVNVHDLYNALESHMKKKCTKAEILVMLQKNSFPGVRVIPEGNGYYQFDETDSSSDDEDSNPSCSGEEPPAPKPVIQKKKVAQITVTPVTKSKPSEITRTRERSERKRIQKVVFDPSDEVIPKKKKGKMEDSKEVNKVWCFVCNEEITKDSSDESACVDCGARVHKSCVSSSSRWGAVRWRCDSCKNCGVCNQKNSSKTDVLINCGVCNDAFHTKCVNVRKTKNTKDWCCETCTRVFDTGDKAVNDESGEESSSPSVASGSSDSKEKQKPVKQVVSEPREKRVKAQKSRTASPEVKERKAKPQNGRRQSRDIKKENGAEEDEEEIPDCSSWTTQQVHSYFMVYATSQDAQVFLDQEVDGKILLLLNRSDVLTRFNMKVGPALKLYSLVKKLQERSSDIRICWP